MIDRSGMAWCIQEFGREEMVQIAIEEWAGASPIYTRRMQRALGMFIVEGIYTSIPLHQRILEDPDFQAGRFDTNFIKRFMPRAD